MGATGPGGSVGATGPVGAMGPTGPSGPAGTSKWKDGTGTVTTDAKVGIGDVGPSYKLSVIDNVASTPAAYVTNSNADGIGIRVRATTKAIEGRIGGSDSMSLVGKMGVYGKVYTDTNSGSLFGVAGDVQADATSGNLFGLYGTATTNYNNNSYGVYGWANTLGSSNYAAGVYGSAVASGGGSCTAYGVYGTATGGGSNCWAGYFEGKLKTTNTSGTNHVYDVAELIPCAKNVEAGDVVAINTEKYREAVRTSQAYDQSVAGIISADPQLSIGDREKANQANPGKNFQFIALAGQVPVKIDASYGQIKPGDILTSSPNPGYAMKSSGPGPSVGIALEPFDGSKNKTGKILCFASLGERNLQKALKDLMAENESQRTRIDQLEKRLKVLELKINSLNK